MFLFSNFVDDWCFTLMFGYVVIGYVKMVCVFCFSVFVDDWCLNVILG